MLKKLHSYIIKEFLYYFIFGVIVFSSLLILNYVFAIMDFLIGKDVTVWAVIKLLLFCLPNFLTVSIPMAVLFGTLLSFGRFSTDNEIVAIKSSGIGYKTLTMPIIVLICCLSLFLVFFNHFLGPNLNSRLKKHYEEVVMKRPLVKFNEKSFTKLGAYEIYSNKVDNSKNTLFGVNIYKLNDGHTEANTKKNTLLHNDSEGWRIKASSATVKAYTTGIQLILYKGHWQKASVSDMTNMVHIIFKTYSFFIPFESTVKGCPTNPSEISSPKLIETIKEYKKQNANFTNYSYDYWIRWVYAIAPIVFIIIALPTGMIGMRIEKDSKAIGFGLSLAVIFIYYTLLEFSISIGQKGYVPMGVILWLPNVLIGMVGAYLFIRMIKR